MSQQPAEEQLDAVSRAQSLIETTLQSLGSDFATSGEKAQSAATSSLAGRLRLAIQKSTTSA